MQFIYIETNEYTSDLLSYLRNEISNCSTSNIDIDIYVDFIETDLKHIIVCKPRIKKDSNINLNKSYSLLIKYISNLLTNYIILKFEPKLISRIINSNYCYFNLLERKEILKTSLQIIKNDTKTLLIDIFNLQRRNNISRKLTEFFETAKSITLEGFVNFRLKEYIKTLEEIVERAVDAFVMEREYKEFIRLLKYFVDIQDSKCNVIHIIIGFDSKYTLLDETKKEITNECIKEFIDDISSEELNSDDWLVSSLITMAPKKVVIHGLEQFKNKELLETIRSIFPQKVFFCNKLCEFCSAQLIHSGNTTSAHPE